MTKKFDFHKEIKRLDNYSLKDVKALFFHMGKYIEDNETIKEEKDNGFYCREGK